MVSLARAMSVWSKSQMVEPFGRSMMASSRRVVAALGEQERDHALLDETIDDAS